MGWGGKREGAGRKVGSRLQKTAVIAHRLTEEGQTPLEYILSVMRDPLQPSEVRLDCAKAAAPYIHPRLAMVHNKVETDAAAMSREQVRSALLGAFEMAKEIHAQNEAEKINNSRLSKLIDATPLSA